MSPQELNELRIYALSMQQFLPLLEKRRAVALGNLLQKFNQGQDVLRETAKLSALYELETEIKGKLRTFEQVSKENV